MSARTRNLLVVGVGLHFEQNHLPALRTEVAAGRVGRIVGLDVLDARRSVERIRARLPVRVPVYYTVPPGPDLVALPAATVRQLDWLVDRHRIDAVIVACEPTHHARYARWAIDRGLPILLDKPVTLRPDSANSEHQAQAIRTDYEDLVRRLGVARQGTPDLFAQVLCQRRFHPVYRTMRAMVEEVSRETGCGITSIQSFHSDGQWRLPNELLEIDYHSFNRGYGKLGHSGYHFMDLMAWLLQASWGDRPADELRAVTQVTRPVDYLAQVPPESYEAVLDAVPFSSSDVRERIAPKLAGYGEVDAFSTLSFRRDGRVLTLGSLNLVHNGFSMRHSALPNLADLYRGNGRVRQESHIVEQGPFQAMHVHSYRSGDDSLHPSSVGGSGHIDLHVFRNSRVRKTWTTYERISAGSLTGGRTVGDVQGEGRSLALRSFVGRLAGGAAGLDGPGASGAGAVSDLEDHRLSCSMLAATFTSLAREAAGRSPVVHQELVT